VDAEPQGSASFAKYDDKIGKLDATIKRMARIERRIGATFRFARLVVIRFLDFPNRNRYCLRCLQTAPMIFAGNFIRDDRRSAATPAREIIISPASRL